jgi:hypothetical protein
MQRLLLLLLLNACLANAVAAEPLRLVRFGPPGEERPGLLDADGRVRDLSGVVADLGGSTLAELRRLDDLSPAALPLVPGNPRLGPPVAGTRKIIAMGFNYADHAEESDVALPPEPLLFSKAVTALSGPYDEVVAPRGHTMLDYEVELVIVIGRTARYVAEADALEYVAGFTVGHDVSERHFPEPPRRSVRQGQERGYLCAGRSLAGADAPRRERAGTADTFMGERGAAPGLRHPIHGVRRRVCRQLHQPVHDAAAR